MSKLVPNILKQYSEFSFCLNRKALSFQKFLASPPILKFNLFWLVRSTSAAYLGGTVGCAVNLFKTSRAFNGGRLLFWMLKLRDLKRIWLISGMIPINFVWGFLVHSKHWCLCLADELANIHGKSWDVASKNVGPMTF